MEAHSLFLQAAGAPAHFVHALAEREELPEATPRQEALIAFAEKLTRSPQTFTERDTQALRCALPDEGEVVEAATVVAGFNFANRVADALDVPLEVPRFLASRRLLRHATMTFMSFGMRLRMNFINRTIAAPPPDEVIAALSAEINEARIGHIPGYFQKLRLRPHILASQAEICTSLLREPGFAPEVVRKIGYLVSTINKDDECASGFARQLADDGIAGESLDRITLGDEVPGSLEGEILKLVRDITLHAEKITDSQVNCLKRQGLGERQLLNLVLLSASYNAGNRLNRALAGPPA